MKEIKITEIKKLSKKRRTLYLNSSLNLSNIDNQLSILLPVLSVTINKIKEEKPFTHQIKEVSQIFEYVTENEAKENAINALEYLQFCFENGCKAIQKIIRRELRPLMKDIEHLIDFELKKIIRTSSFSLFGFLKI